MHKQGTPTMGGLAIVVAAFFGWLVAHLRPGSSFSNQAAIMWVGILVMSGMGFLDDYIKVNKAHNRGIFWKKKSYITLAISIGIAWWLVAATGVSETISFTRPQLAGLARAVAGLGGVRRRHRSGAPATRSTSPTVSTASPAARRCSASSRSRSSPTGRSVTRTSTASVRVNPLDLAVLAAAFAGACGGFLWFNAAPARIFMGDVGALGIGTALGTAGADHQHPAAAGADLRHQRDGGRLGRRADGRVQSLRPQESPLPHVADPSPLRARRLAGDDGHHPLLADRRHLRRHARWRSSSPTSRSWSCR